MNNDVVRKIVIILAVSTLALTSCSQAQARIGDKCNSNLDTITENQSGKLLWCEHRNDALHYGRWVPIKQDELNSYIENKNYYIYEKNKCEEVLSNIINKPWNDAITTISNKGLSYGYDSVEGWFVGGGSGPLINLVSEDGIVVADSSFGCIPKYLKISNN